MRWTLTVLLLIFVALPSWAAKQETVAQLEKFLISELAAHRSDTDIARRISSIELSERLTDATLGRLNKELAKDPQTAMALLLLADRSAFLEPPLSELPGTAAPEAASQQAMLQAAQRFALETLPRLPNLLATRTTFSFDDSPQEVIKGGYLQRTGLHLLGTSKAEVSVHNERGQASAGPSQSQTGLSSWGEFGSALLIIMSDSSQGAVKWSHWEQASSGLLAVFHYEVPQSASHYEVETAVEDLRTNAASGRWARSEGGTARSATTRTVRRKPGYHGSLWIDPATGTVFRLTLVADLKGDPTFESSAILVDYGPVQIGDKTLICPVRSLALTTAPSSVNTTLAGDPTEWLNENLFTGYHLFGSTSRILSAEGGSPTPQAAPKQPDTPPEVTAAVADQPQTSAADQVPSTPAPEVETPPTGSLNQVAIAPSTLTPSPEIAAAPALPVPAPAISTRLQTPDTGITFHINVNSVLVPVVVRDGHGHIIDNLQKADFEVFDDGRPRPLSGFLVETSPLSKKAGLQNVSTPKTVTQPQELPDRIIVFVFDDMHLAFADIARVQKAAVKALDGALTGSGMAAVVSTSGKINSGLTRDRAKLTDAIMALRPAELYRSNAADCPRIEYYQADLIVNKRDPNALQDAINQVMFNCNPNLTVQAAGDLARRIAESTAMRTLQLGEQDVLTTYDAIADYVRRIAKLPGQHTMILVSSGFLPIENAARNAESRLMNLAAASNLTISALDARGLYGTAETASDDMRNRNATLLQDYRQSEMRAEENSMGELTDATGGVFFHNNNDLDAGFAALLEPPETLYVLELPLDEVKPNGAYHSLSVKIDRADAHVQARRGYVAPEAPHQK